MPAYEALRAGALGAPIPVAARHGLTLFLRRGMWAWFRALQSTTSPPMTHRPADSSPLEQRPVLARLLAEMTLAPARSTP